MKNLKGFKSAGKDQKSDNLNAGSAEAMINNYSGMSEDALFEKLMSEVASAKSKGDFSAEELSKGIEQMKAYMSPAQQEKMAHLLRLISSN